MAQSNVQVIFGASTVNLLAGVKQVEEAIRGLRAPVDEVFNSLRSIAEVSGAAFVFEHLKEAVESVAEAAEKLDIMAQAVGTSAAALSEFQNVAKIAGGEVENMIRVVTMIGRQLKTGLTDPLSEQRHALDAASIGFNQLRDAMQDPLALFELLRQTWERLAGDPDRLNIFRGLAGSPRFFQQLLPYLELTNEQVEKFAEFSRQAGASLSAEQIRGLHDTAEEINKAGIAVEGFGKQVVLYMKEPIDAALKSMQEFVIYVTTHIPDVGKALKEFFDIEPFRKAIRDWSQDWEEFKRWWDNVQEFFGHGRPGGTTRAGEEARAPLPPPLGVSYGQPFGPPIPTTELKGLSDNAKQVADALARLGLNSEQTAGFLANLQRESGIDPRTPGGGIAQWIGDRVKQLKEAEGPAWDTLAGQIDFMVKELTGKFAPMLEHLRGAPSAAEAARIVGGEFEIHHGGTGVAFMAEQARRASLATQIAGGGGLGGGAAAGAGFEEVSYRKDFEAFEANEKRKLAEKHGDYAAQITIEDERLAHVLQIYAKDGEAAGKASKEYQEILAERTRFQQRADEERLKDMVRTDQTAERQLEYGLKERVLRGQMTEAQATGFLIQEYQKRYQAEIQAYEQAGQKTEELEARHAEKMAQLEEQWVKDSLKSLQELQKEYKQIFDQIGSQLTSTITSMITRSGTLRDGLKRIFDEILGDFIKMVGEMLAHWAALRLAMVIPGAAAETTLGGVLSHLLPTFGLFGAAGGWVVPAAQRGWVVPSFQGGGILSMVHANEMVLPADISSGIQAAIRGGGLGGGTTINVQAWDHRDVARWARSNASLFMGAINHANRMGWQPRTQ